MVLFSCPRCGKSLQVKDELAGRRARCPSCRQPVDIPGASPPDDGAIKLQPLPPRFAAPIRAAAPLATPVLAPAAGPVRPVFKMGYVAIFMLSMISHLVWSLAQLNAVATSHGPPTTESSPADAGLAGISSLAGLAALIAGLVLLGKMWGAIQAGPARTTPGKAVGLLFVPVFNVYWIFQAIGGWPADYNAFVRIRNIRAPRMADSLGYMVCLLQLAYGVLSAVVMFKIIQLATDKLAPSASSGPAVGFADFRDVGVLLLLAWMFGRLLVDLAYLLYYSNACGRINALARAPAEAFVPMSRAPLAPLSGLAVASLVAGTLGFCTAGISALVGLVLGAAALRRIENSRGALRGRGLAMFGIAVSALSIVAYIMAYLWLRGQIANR